MTSQQTTPQQGGAQTPVPQQSQSGKPQPQQQGQSTVFKDWASI